MTRTRSWNALVAISVLVLASLARADATAIALDDSHTLRFLDSDAAARAIVSEEGDPFFKSLSNVDIEIRLGQLIDGLSREEAVKLLKDRFRSSVQPWTPGEIEMLSSSCRRILEAEKRRCPGFIPAEWTFVKTDGTDEAGAAYTRGGAIILPVTKLHSARVPSGVDRLVAHETCHVYGRTHPLVRNRLFERLGFSFVGPIAVGDLAARTLTNPDGPIADSVIRISDSSGRALDAAMVLYSQAGGFDPAKGRRVMAYLRFGFFEATATPTGWALVAAPGQSPVGLNVNEVRGFFEKVGRNTAYLIGPDEILAENVSIGLTGPDDQALSNPDLPRDLLEIIRRAGAEPHPK